MKRLLGSRILEEDLHDRDVIVQGCLVQGALVELVHSEDVCLVGDQQLQKS